LITLPETSIAPENGWLEDYLNLFSVHRHVHAFLRGRPPASVHVHLSPQTLGLLYEAVEEADGKGRILYPVHQIRGLRENASGQKVVTKGLLSVDEARPTKQKIRCHRACLLLRGYNAFF